MPPKSTFTEELSSRTMMILAGTARHIANLTSKRPLEPITETRYPAVTRCTLHASFFRLARHSQFPKYELRELGHARFNLRRQLRADFLKSSYRNGE
jgi:hypothetical protein